MAASAYSVSLKKENAHNDPLYCCVWTRINFENDSNAAPKEIIATADSKAVIKLWQWTPDNNKLELRNVLRGHALSITGLAVSPDGHTLLSTALDFTLVIWDTVSGVKVHAIQSSSIWRATFSSDGMHIVTGSHSGSLVVYNVENGDKISVSDTRQKFVIEVTCCPNGKFVASGSINGAVCVLDAVHLKIMHTFEDHRQSVKSLAFSPNSKLLVSSSIDCTFKLYDVIAGKLLHSLERSSWALGVCFCPDNKRVALGTEDGEIIVASIEGLQVLKTFIEHDGAVWEVQFNAKGDRLVSIGKDRRLNMYECPPLPKK